MSNRRENYLIIPYTTLFRSSRRDRRRRVRLLRPQFRPADERRRGDRHDAARRPVRRRGERDAVRSEEHTSELQSLRHLVCRPLLEKKNESVKQVTKKQE